VLPIFVPTRAVCCPATLALTTEGLEVTEVVMYDYTNYGRAFTEQWQSGHGFIVVEDDVVPWPGAIREFDACPEEWCLFEHPRGRFQESPRSGFATGLGCVKFSTELVQRVPFNPGWQNRGHNELDGLVHETLLEADAVLHIHYPPVAHVKAQTLTYKRSYLPVSNEA